MFGLDLSSNQSFGASPATMSAFAGLHQQHSGLTVRHDAIIDLGVVRFGVPPVIRTGLQHDGLPRFPGRKRISATPHRISLHELSCIGITGSRMAFDVPFGYDRCRNRAEISQTVTIQPVGKIHPHRARVNNLCLIRGRHAT